MKVLFEGYKYKYSDIEKVFGKQGYLGWVTRADKFGAYLSCVGYFYNKEDNTQFFILPKVFAFSEGNETDRAFGVKGKELKSGNGTDFSPIFDIDEFKAEKDGLDVWEVDIIHKLPVYIFLAILRYRTKYTDSVNNYEANLLDAAGLTGSADKTFLEMIMSLQQFYNEHRQLFVYVYKMTHSGYNKISWNRTVHTQTAIRNNSNYIYPTTVNKRKTIDYDERLLVIFFNTLGYIQEEYNYPLKYECFYNLDSTSAFKQKAKNGLILKELKRIRQNYFRDEFQKLWQLLFNFYDIEHNMKAGNGHNEYLLVRKFDRIFEDMINDLIGDNITDKKRKVLVEQRDDKIVDHLFLYRAVDDYTDHDDKVYYIGDSKYYKGSTGIEGSSYYKQFTYARNIIQQEIAWMLTDDPEDIDQRYRNEKTEGYKITPNFFILGRVRPDYTLHKSELEQDRFFDFDKNKSIQWKNRLFDRDTLFLEKYYINFLFVLDSYVHADSYKNKKFKDEAKRKFRKDFIFHLNQQYHFYLLRLKPSYTLDEALDRYFRVLIGKIYLSTEEITDRDSQYVLMAYENKKWEKAADELSLIQKIAPAFETIEYKLGDNIEETVKRQKERKLAHQQLFAKGIPDLRLQVAEPTVDSKATLLVGCFKSDAHYDWILKNKCYNVRLGSLEGSVEDSDQYKEAEYLLLYDVNNPEICDLYELFVKRGKKTRKELLAMGYPDEDKRGEDQQYFIYYLKGEILHFYLDKDEFQNYLEHIKKGAPFYTQLGRLMR